jgi:hypothetical protein
MAYFLHDICNCRLAILAIRTFRHHKHLATNQSPIAGEEGITLPLSVYSPVFDPPCPLTPSPYPATQDIVPEAITLQHESGNPDTAINTPLSQPVTSVVHFSFSSPVAVAVESTSLQHVPLRVSLYGWMG